MHYNKPTNKFASIIAWKTSNKMNQVSLYIQWIKVTKEKTFNIVFQSRVGTVETQIFVCLSVTKDS